MAVPVNIGRFQISKELGAGSQGIVYLAEDPLLEREVAIKTLHMRFSSSDQRHSRLMREARTVSKLQHPNIIQLFEAGEHEGLPFLVFEYVNGVSLRDSLKNNGIPAIHESVSLMIQILDGISYAHQNKVVHRDLSPSNILIDTKGTPRIMDFGISIMVDPEKSHDQDLSGTPCYMSPEHFSKTPLGPHSDIFSLGLILYELLVGQPALQADNHFAVMYKIANDSIKPPSYLNRTIDQHLDRVVLRAANREIASRYANTLEMKNDLETYLHTDDEGEDNEEDHSSSHSTLGFLLRRMRKNSNFPTFSQNVIKINKMASAAGRNLSSASELSNEILKDYSLTNKLLKLVNSAFYGYLSGEITTVSRAVVILGFEEVRLAAVSLMLFEHIQNKAQSDELKDAAFSSFMSGMIARDLASKMKLKETEEALICSMLNKLGRQLVIYYFPEEYEQIKQIMAQKGINEETASRSILGISYDDLGMGVARSWNFPKSIVSSMINLPEGEVSKPTSDDEMLRIVSGFANELCQIASTTSGNERKKALSNLQGRFKGIIPVSERQIFDILDSARKNVEKYSGVLKVNLKKSSFFRRIVSYSEDRQKNSSNLNSESLKAGKAKTGTVEKHVDSDILPQDHSDDQAGLQNLLIKGIQDITNTLLGDYVLNDLLTIVLETMYRGFGFTRVLLCFKDSNQNKIKARLGLGKDIDEIIENFRFKITKSADVFYLAVIHGKDISIENAHDTNIKAKIPEWYRASISAPAFALFPISMDNKFLGLFYVDRDQAGSVISEKHLNYMKTLRNQTALAIKQKR